ncbi:MAG: hypothetical protein ISS57_10540 [Anaerolineales bacterium]|nr:hypothetical protein [Chloroflexota bacterium]MBL7163034.1 hypothetical protein [Anaerolineales bacterium]
MNILLLFHNLYGQRIADNLNRQAPRDWQLQIQELPRALPPIVDEPEEFLPAHLPPADLVLHLAETSQAAQLLPGVVRLCGAQAVIAPIDNDAWIPPGLRRQLRRELAALGAAIIFPEPFCSLTEDLISTLSDLHPAQHEVLLAVARHFGRPRLQVILGADETISEVIVERGAACGSSQHAAEHLRGIPAHEAVPKGGLICLHYPCLASMQPTKPKDGVENLMHLSGIIFNEELKKALQRAVRPDAK